MKVPFFVYLTAAERRLFQADLPAYAKQEPLPPRGPLNGYQRGATGASRKMGCGPCWLAQWITKR